MVHPLTCNAVSLCVPFWLSLSLQSTVKLCTLLGYRQSNAFLASAAKRLETSPLMTFGLNLRPLSLSA